MASIKASAAGHDVSLDTDRIANAVSNVFTTIGTATREAVNTAAAKVSTSANRFTLDESVNFVQKSGDTDEVAFLKQHAQHWKDEAQNWRLAYHESQRSDR